MSAGAAAPVQEVYRNEAGRQQISSLYSRTLEALPFAHQELDVRTSSFGRVHVVVCGPPQAPPLMLWHGAAAPAPFMLTDCKPLAERYRIYAPDLPCQGNRGLTAQCTASSRAVLPCLRGFRCVFPAWLSLVAVQHWRGWRRVAQL